MQIPFYKITAAGNDFILFYNLKKNGIKIEKLVKNVCLRNFGIGADGVIILKKYKKTFYLDYFNSDGSKAFCGNGARSAALWINLRFNLNRFYINTSNKKLFAYVENKKVYLEMPKPDFVKEVILGRYFEKGYYIKTGTFHLVILCKDIAKLDVISLGRYFRYHRLFKPMGVNVNFVEILKKDDISAVFRIRTYEKGVENETYSCSSGIASTFYFAKKYYGIDKATFITRKGYRFYIETIDRKTFISGPVKIICSGIYYW